MGMIKVNTEKCKGCGICIRFCPHKTLVPSKNINSKGYHPAEQTDAEKCNGCGICAQMCPDVAIEVWR